MDRPRVIVMREVAGPRAVDTLLEQIISFCFGILNSGLISLSQKSDQGNDYQQNVTQYNAWLFIFCGGFGFSILILSCFWHLCSPRAARAGKLKIFEEHFSGKNLPLFIAFMIILTSGILLRRMLSSGDPAQNSDRIAAVNKFLVLAGYLTGFDREKKSNANETPEITAPEPIEVLSSTSTPIRKMKKESFRFLIEQLVAMRNSQLASKTTELVGASLSITKFSVLRADAITDLFYGVCGIGFSLIAFAYDCISGKASAGYRRALESHFSGKPLQLLFTFVFSSVAGAIRLGVLDAQAENANTDALIFAAVLAGFAGYLGSAKASRLPGLAGQLFSERSDSPRASTAEPITTIEIPLEIPRAPSERVARFPSSTHSL